MTLPIAGQTGQIPGMTYFRPGEITLLLKPPDDRRRECPEVTEGDLGELRRVLVDVGVFLNAHPLQRPNGEPRPRIVVQRSGNRVWSDRAWPGRGRRRYPQPRTLVLQTVNLRSWNPAPENARGNMDLATPIAEVGLAVNHINDRLDEGRGPLMVGRYEVVAAAPNWQTTAFV